MLTASVCLTHARRTAATTALALALTLALPVRDAAAAKRASDRAEAHCLATAIYFEARGESVRGQRAVAEVILARVRTPGRPKTICGVVYQGAWRKNRCQFSFACDGRSDVARGKKAWARAKAIAAAALRQKGKKRLVHGATFYHASYVHPRWSKRMVRVAQIGTHIFYRPRRGRLL